MNDRECVRFLQWSLPLLRLRWPGYRKVRRQVCKRIARRIRELGLSGTDAYQGYLSTHPEEWQRLDNLCWVTISRFFRDKGVFVCLERRVIPVLVHQALGRGDRFFRIWSCGCASGEEPYSLAILWRHSIQPHFPSIGLRITATDCAPMMLERAHRACYPFSSLKELPPPWRKTAFFKHQDTFCLRKEYRQSVEFLTQDIRRQRPPGPFDLVLCRNLVFTYFEEALQQDISEHIHDCLYDGGALVLGKHETIPETVAEDWQPWFNQDAIYRVIHTRPT